MLCSRCKERSTTVRGLCNRCYTRRYYSTHPKSRERKKELTRKYRKENPNLQKEQYQKDKLRPEYLAKKKCWGQKARDKARYGGNKKIVLERDNFRCIICNKPTRTIHHKDGKAYHNSKQPNNNPDNLITCCSSCHMKYFHREIILKNLVNREPWNKGLTVKDPRVAKNMIGIKYYWHGRNTIS